MREAINNTRERHFEAEEFTEIRYRRLEPCCESERVDQNVVSFS